MSKRFTDTGKYDKRFFRGLPGPYKLLWDFLYHECDHAGLWEVDWQIAQIKLGADMPVEEKKALDLFNQEEVRVVILKCGRKWYLPGFIEFQYNAPATDLDPKNRVHASVLASLRKEGIKGLPSPLQGAKDKDKDKEKDKDKDRRLIPDRPGDLHTVAELKAAGIL